MMVFQRALPDRPVSGVVVKSIALDDAQARRLQQPRRGDDGRALATGLGLVVVVALAPFGGRPNFMDSSSLLAALTSVQGSDVAVATVSVQAHPLCGNGICETGERLLCGGDCLVPAVTCPVSTNGFQCSGRGWCAPASGGDVGPHLVAGVCVCNALQGYAGSACDQCAQGFVPQAGVGSAALPACVRLEVTQLPTGGGNGSSSHLGIILGVVLGVGVPLLVLAVWAAVTCRRRGAQAGLSHSLASHV
jgi:hypothetical protein